MSEKKPKILLAPMNMAAMPVTIVQALRAAGYEAAHIQYTSGKSNPLQYQLDRTVDLTKGQGRISTQMDTLRQTLDEGFDIFHFWNRSLSFRLDYGSFSGLDLPLIKARGRRIAYRFTGYDLRLPGRDLAVNPHSPFRYEQAPIFNERLVESYQDFLREYVDAFLVQDPELQQFFPDAEIIPRALNLQDWGYVGVERTARPLIVHAPTNPAAKGTRFILAAVETLRAEGLAFDFKLLRGLPHAEARKIYEQADVIVDQILIGATGVLTLEAWALGKPVIVNLRRDLFEPFYDTTDLPVINANPDTILDQLRLAIKDADLRLELAPRGRALVEDRHDINQVIDQYIAFYERLYRTPLKQPQGDGDIRYLQLQLEMSERAEGFWRRWRARYRNALYRQAHKPNIREDGRLPNRFERTRERARAIGPLVRKDLSVVWDAGLRLLRLKRD